MDKELTCPSCGVSLHLVDEVELQVVKPVVADVLKPESVPDPVVIVVPTKTPVEPASVLEVESTS